MAKRGTSPSAGNVVLRDVIEEDLPVLFEHQRDPEANRMAAFPARDRDAFMAHWHGILLDGSVLAKTVVVDGQVAGNVVSFERFGKREVGYWIGRDHWGRGIATAALSEFLARAPERPLHARVAEHNVASIRVLEKCGFRAATEDSGPAHEPLDDVEEVLLELA
jgi:RimJ/RimL family protein N-acetyltransferase